MMLSNALYKKFIFKCVSRQIHSYLRYNLWKQVLISQHCFPGKVNLRAWEDFKWHARVDSTTFMLLSGAYYSCTERYTKFWNNMKVSKWRHSGWTTLTNIVCMCACCLTQASDFALKTDTKRHFVRWSQQSAVTHTSAPQKTQNVTQLHPGVI